MDFLKDTQFRYTAWVSEPQTLVFSDPDGQTHQFEAPKRGNAAYNRRVEKRFQPIQAFFEWLEPEGYGLTRFMFITLTINRRIPLERAWRTIGPDYSNFTVKLRKILGSQIRIIRCFEAHKDGHPHIHALIYTPEPFPYFSRNKKYRVDNNNIVKAIKMAWTKKHPLCKRCPIGFVDIQAFINGRYAIDYIFKYITKSSPRDDKDFIYNPVTRHWRENKLSIALLWHFKKRSFSISESLKASSDLIRGTLHNSYFCVPHLPWIFLGLNTPSGFIPKSHFHTKIKQWNYETKRHVACLYQKFNYCRAWVNIQLMANGSRSRPYSSYSAT